MSSAKPTKELVAKGVRWLLVLRESLRVTRQLGNSTCVTRMIFFKIWFVVFPQQRILAVFSLDQIQPLQDLSLINGWRSDATYKWEIMCGRQQPLEDLQSKTIFADSFVNKRSDKFSFQKYKTHFGKGSLFIDGNFLHTTCWHKYIVPTSSYTVLFAFKFSIDWFLSIC